MSGEVPEKRDRAVHSLLASLPDDPSTYVRHALHRSERIWTETNCYVDLWIELLHATGFDPVAGTAFTLSTDFEGDQWAFFKYPPEDLRTLYGIEVAEMNVWRPVIDHVVEQLGWDRLLTVEVDSWFLPDTEGVSYRIAHTKSTIVPVDVRPASRTMRYFHNAGFFALDGEDFDGVFGLEDHASEGSGYGGACTSLPPYVELVRFDRAHSGGPPTMQRVEKLVRDHVRRRPRDNPVTRLGLRLLADVDWLRGQGLDAFHLYSFGTCRQCGASAELASSLMSWLVDQGAAELAPARDAYLRLASGAKALQFALARVVRGRDVALADTLSAMESAWSDGMGVLVERYGS